GDWSAGTAVVHDTSAGPDNLDSFGERFAAGAVNHDTGAFAVSHVRQLPRPVGNAVRHAARCAECSGARDFVIAARCHEDGGPDPLPNPRAKSRNAAPDPGNN